MRRGRWLVFAAVAAVAVVAAALLIGSPELPLSSGGGGPRIAQRTKLGFAPEALATAGDDAFVADSDGRLYRVDDGGHVARLTAKAGERPTDMAAGFDSLWVGSTTLVTRRSSEDGRRLGLPVPVANGVTGVAIGARLVWASAKLATGVSGRGRPGDDAIVGGIRPLPAGAYAGSSLVALSTEFPQAAVLSAVAADGTTVWVTDRALDRVYRLEGRAISPSDSIPVGERPVAVTVGYGGVWVANAGDGTVSRIDTGRRRLGADPIRVGGEPTDLVAAEEGVWVADGVRGRVLRIDPATSRVDLRLGVGHDPEAISAGGGSVWVARAGARRDELVRIEP
jgi:DNA-binding beta-propeller fold protein YncE